MDHHYSSSLSFFFIFIVVYAGDRVSCDIFPPEALPTKSGYLPVDPKSSSSMFYAFYEAQTLAQPLQRTPLLIWLQGGPGCSSMVGNFLEVGPWRVNFDRSPQTPLSLWPNPGSWNRRFGLLFLDNPVGVGFSVAARPEDIPKNQTQVARHLYAAITRFIRSNPGFESRPVYITGESYAGKYVPAIGYHILRRRRGGAGRTINLAGVAIGNGLTEPAVQVGVHAAVAHAAGLINERQRLAVEQDQAEAARLARAGEWTEAMAARTRFIRMLENMTGLATLYDSRRVSPSEFSMVEELLREDSAGNESGENKEKNQGYEPGRPVKQAPFSIRKALGVAESAPVFESCRNSVMAALYDDVMKSAIGMAEYLVKKSRVLLYQGCFDLQEGPASSESWVKTMDWDGVGRFMAAERKVWKVNGELAGYVQRSGRLTNVVVHGAGHMVPRDQAVNSRAMIEDWVLGRGLFDDALEEDAYERGNNGSRSFA